MWPPQPNQQPSHISGSTPIDYHASAAPHTSLLLVHSHAFVQPILDKGVPNWAVLARPTTSSQDGRAVPSRKRLQYGITGSTAVLACELEGLPWCETAGKHARKPACKSACKFACKTVVKLHV